MNKLFSKFLLFWGSALATVVVFAGLETPTYISDLVSTNPLSSDPASQGDDHIRNLKTAIKNTFPNINNAVTVTDENLNGILDATNLTSGTLPNGRFPATLPAANGSNLTFLNASNLGSGTIPDARFPATLPAASGINLTALNATNLGSGTVPDARFPATLPAASGANLTALNATNISSGTIANARLPSTINVTTLQQNSSGVWTAANDGAASGLDADLLDGNSSAFYTDMGNASAGTLAIARGGTGQTDGTARNITGKAGVTKTLSTSAASGGSDGDIWYRY